MFIFISLGFLNTQETSKIIDQLVTTLSSDSTEVACEKECHILITDSTSVFQHMCPFLCHSWVYFIHFHYKEKTKYEYSGNYLKKDIVKKNVLDCIFSYTTFLLILITKINMILLLI